MKVKIKYLNWDKEGHEELLKGLTSGVKFEDDCYRDVTSFELGDGDEEYALHVSFQYMNRIDDELTCKIPEGERSMCSGDLIYYNEKVFVVAPIGFKEVV